MSRDIIRPMQWIFPLGMLLIFELTADIFAKEWSLSTHGWLWAFALAAYLIGNAFWLLALKNGAELSRGAIIFSLASEMLALAVGVLHYHEIIRPIQWVGIVLGMLSLVLILW